MYRVNNPKEEVVEKNEFDDIRPLSKRSTESQIISTTLSQRSEKERIFTDSFTRGQGTNSFLSSRQSANQRSPKSKPLERTSIASKSGKKARLAKTGMEADRDSNRFSNYIMRPSQVLLTRDIKVSGDIENL